MALLSLFSIIHSVSSSSSMPSHSEHQLSAFVNAAATSSTSTTHAEVRTSTPSKKLKTTSVIATAGKRRYSSLPLYDASDQEQVSPPRKQRARPPRRGNPPRNNRAKPGLSNMCPPLAGPVGAPELPVLTTRDPRIIERWLNDHVSADGYSILGYDQESIAKPPWKPERASLPDGPATMQLSTPSSCIIIQLSRCGDGSVLHAPDILRKVINNPKIMKVGVGLDDDALELYRWSKESYDTPQQQGDDKLWSMKSRFDLGCILPYNNNPGRRLGLRALALQVLGVEVLKSKKMSMSNWGKRHLDMGQIAYAARDAWVSAAIVDLLQKHDNKIFGVETLMEMECMRSQRDLNELDERATHRKAAKIALKEIVERQKADGVEKAISEEDDVRKQELYGLMDLYRPDQPHAFDEDAVSSLTLYE